MLEFVSRRLTSTARQLASDKLIALIIIMMVLVPFLMGSSTSYRWHGVKAVGFEVGCVLLVCIVIARIRFNQNLSWIKQALSRSPNSWLCACLLWSIVSFAFSSEKGFAGTALMQLFGGALLYFCLSQKVKSKAQFELVLDAFVGVAILGSVMGFVMYGNSNTDQGGGLFVDHQLFGAFLMLMLPVTLVVGFMPTSTPRRIAGQVASVICASCLLLARTRASWIGEGVALTMLGVLCYRYYIAGRRESLSTGERRNRLAGYLMPAIAFVSAVVIFVSMSHMGGSFTSRALSMGQTISREDGSFESRVQAWNGALRMIAAKPLVGWGIGTYAVHQQQFTHLGSPEWAVLRNGPSLSEQAHDYYLQTAAETGIVGLVLWTGFLTALFVRAFRKLRTIGPEGTRQRVLIGCLAALSGQVVDSIANPSWQFGDLMLFFWVMAGLSMAATGIADYKSTTSESASRAPLSTSGLFTRRVFRAAAAGVCGLALFSVIANTTWALPAEAYCSQPCVYRCCSDTTCKTPCPAPCKFSCKSHTTCVVYSCGDSGHGYQSCAPISCVLACPKGAIVCSYSGYKITLSQPKIQCAATLTCTFADGEKCSVPCTIGA